MKHFCCKTIIFYFLFFYNPNFNDLEALPFSTQSFQHAFAEIEFIGKYKLLFN